MATISLTADEVAERAAEVQLPIGERIDDPDVLTAIRLAFVAPEPGDEPHSQLVKAIDAAGWDAGQVIEASAVAETRRRLGTRGLLEGALAGGGRGGRRRWGTARPRLSGLVPRRSDGTPYRITTACAGTAGSAVVLGVHDAAADRLAIGKIDEDVRCGVEDGHLVMSAGSAARAPPRIKNRGRDGVSSATT